MNDFDEFREFKVTTKEVWRDMQEFRRVTQEENATIREMLSTINSKLDVLTVTTTHTDTAIKDHEERLRGLEKIVWRAAGIAAFVGASAGILVSLFNK